MTTVVSSTKTSGEDTGNWIKVFEFNSPGDTHGSLTIDMVNKSGTGSINTNLAIVKMIDNTTTPANKDIIRDTFIISANSRITLEDTIVKPTESIWIKSEIPDIDVRVSGLLFNDVNTEVYTDNVIIDTTVSNTNRTIYTLPNDNTNMFSIVNILIYNSTTVDSLDKTFTLKVGGKVYESNKTVVNKSTYLDYCVTLAPGDIIEFDPVDTASTLFNVRLTSLIRKL